MDPKIPPQYKGAQTDAYSEIIFDDDAAAMQHFQTVRKRFLDVNSWEFFAGEEKAEFSLRDENGELTLEEPKVNHFIKIKVPLLHNSDDGYDWVQIEEVQEEITPEKESVFIKVRPSQNPTKPENDTKHFLDSDATSNFIIKREGTKICAEVHARNETPNTDDHTLLEKIRDKIVALGGMLLGSKIQWEGFTSGLIKYEEE
ncbi:hypothetical protein SAMN05421638_0487 [Kaistella treverensis]|uniref:Uncharacterized protein n=1 Tax=Kaistella treverensis TaxID=631455 RepID=A0A1I3JYW7_9FLAO|nr:hypothetical protein [Kaistella treverensis]SFI65467.1 hypothetical protein SAMN05421638_0487 [Kaistella treverensis]